MSVFFTGITHHSGMVNWQVVRRRLEGDTATTSALDAIADAARLCRQALVAQEEGEVAAAVAAEWAARQRLAPEVCPPDLARIERAAKDAGVSAVKACGAGGGGSLLLWHPVGLRAEFASALTEVAPKGRLFDPGVARDGCQVLVNERER
jgi:D-glycero-alpha-D-manno-heptose-7-phosphate kinase